jgi:hypothetical protein
MTQQTIRYFFIIGLLASVLFPSCRTIDLSSRNGKDLELNSTNYQQLSGTFSNTNAATDSSRYFHRTLMGNFENDSIYSRKGLSAVLLPVSPKTLSLKIYSKDSLISSLTLKGKYKSGHFKVRRRFTSSFISGPLFWVLAASFNYIGLTKENNLVILNSGGVGALFITILPIAVTGADQSENTFQRIK